MIYHPGRKQGGLCLASLACGAGGTGGFFTTSVRWRRLSWPLAALPSSSVCLEATRLPWLVPEASNIPGWVFTVELPFWAEPHPREVVPCPPPGCAGALERTMPSLQGSVLQPEHCCKRTTLE